jgi:vacuolar-type H+-ATPase subunit F/Vma7
MAAPVFIGDEWTAAGWRLAGCDTDCPEAEPGAVGAALDRARASSGALVLISGEFAALLSPARLAEMRASLDPPLVVVGDAARRGRPDDVTGDIRERMGVAR